MSLERKIKQAKARRASRVRNKLKRHSSRPRVCVFRSSKQIYVQLIDDSEHKTVVSSSSTIVKASGDKKAQAHAVGIDLAKKALEKGVKDASFDRGRFLYHGRVKALAEGLREGGLNI